jgi:hypothetical protein
MFSRVNQMIHRRFFLIAMLLVLSGVASTMGPQSVRSFLIWLPGTQPGQVNEAQPSSQCGTCHPQQVREWQGSMMAHATRDPLFNALLSITTKHALPRGMDTPEYCLRCHSPSGWLAGRSHELSVSALFGTDLDGVHCDFCHRSVDPVRPDSTGVIAGTVTGYGNGMYVVQTDWRPVRGSRGGLPEHCEDTVVDSFYTTSEYCGVCHEVSNPYFSPNPSTTPPHAQPAMERTYSEWKESWFAAQGKKGTCQSCHMKPYAGFSAITQVARHRPDIASHEFSGGNILALRLTDAHWNSVDQAAIEQGIRKSEQTLREAVRLEAAAGRDGGRVKVLARLTNLTGHKLPTGFAEGRRMWVHVEGQNAAGQILFISGMIDPVTGRLLQDLQLKTYEAHPGVSQISASQLGILPGASFLTAFNDSMYYDSRIPPRGFDNEAFRLRKAEPVGASYADGQYWDLVEYTLPPEVTSLSITVRYQQVTEEFARFLRDENRNNPYDWNAWGEKVYDGWLQWGGPVDMASRKLLVSPGPPRLSTFQEIDVPAGITLSQNYPNPFNGATWVEFSIGITTRTLLTLHDVSGRLVATVLDEEMPTGSHTAMISADHLASGVYFYRLTVGGEVRTKKMLLLR